MKRFSGGKNGKKVKEKKSTRKERKEQRQKDLQCSQFLPIFTNGDWDLKDFLESQGCNLKPKESTSRSSRLSPSLKETLTSPLALAYFIEFLDTKDLKHLVDFWLAVQAFTVVATERCKLSSNEPFSTGQDSSNTDQLSNETEYCWECRNLRWAIDSSNSRLKSNCVSCNHRRNATKQLVDGHNEVSECLVNGNTHLGLEPMQYLHNLDTCSDPANRTDNLDAGSFSSNRNDNLDAGSFSSNWTDNSSTGIHFAENWEPFSTPTKSSQSKMNDNSETNKRRDSYVARRIMSKQTRIRTKSAVVDAVGLYARYVSLDADQPLGLPSNIRNQIEAEICRYKDNVSPHCFKEAQGFILKELEPIHKQFLENSHGNKYKLYLLRETKPRLQDILYNETSLFYFMEYLDRENCREVLEFWLMTENFEQNVQQKMSRNEYDSIEASEDAMAIYEKYFSMRSKHQIIKDDKLRIVIENNICREDGPQPNCFCIPEAYAWTVMKEVFFERFLASENFLQLLESICKSSVERSKNDEVSSTTSSDSRSESTEFLPTSISMSDFLDKDADDLWYRPDAGRLAMGYVNPLGVFVTDLDSPELETEQDKSSVSKLGKAMKNLLNKESKEEKERIAWEKAKKIVEDVQRQANRH